MSQNIALGLVAVLMIGLIPLVPKLIMFRVKVLRWFKWNRLADWHERNIKILTPIIRGIMLLMIILISSVILTN